MNIKMIDFGLSNTYREGELLKTACGSPCYAAPEMIAGSEYNGLRTDIWSCGVILYALLCGYLPFEDPDTSKLYAKIMKPEYELPDFISPDAKDLISKILKVDPDQRITPEGIMNHPWWSLSKTPVEKGIKLGYSPVPINQKVLRKLKDYGYDLVYAKNCLEAHIYNDITTAYYLLMKKMKENEGTPEIPVVKTRKVYRLSLPPTDRRSSIAIRSPRKGDRSSVKRRVKLKNENRKTRRRSALRYSQQLDIESVFRNSSYLFSPRNAF